MSIDETIITNLHNLEEKGDKKPYLTFIKGPRLGQLVALEADETTVGRAPDCVLCIEDSAISRHHFKLCLEDEGVRLVDLKSTNGTYVNGARVNKTYVQDGDRIRISQDTLLEFTYKDESRSLSEKQLYEMGVMDAGTNIYNKRFFLDRLREEFAFARRKKRNLSVVIFDIDHFKKLNDTYGHLAGDLALEKICSVIQPFIRSDDIFARYGGEEFVILMRDSQVKAALDLAERIRKLIETTKITYENQDLHITLSCGVSSFKDEFADHLALVAAADKCLYQSKQAGRNRVTGPTG